MLLFDLFLKEYLKTYYCYNSDCAVCFSQYLYFSTLTLAGSLLQLLTVVGGRFVVDYP